eukprot:6202398-Pleurochrysis_carterae.AAC.7
MHLIGLPEISHTSLHQHILLSLLEARCGGREGKSAATAAPTRRVASRVRVCEQRAAKAE